MRQIQGGGVPGPSSSDYDIAMKAVKFKCVASLTSYCTLVKILYVLVENSACIVPELALF